MPSSTGWSERETGTTTSCGPRDRGFRLWLNGVQTVDYTEQDRSIEASGVIAVQIHAGPPSEAWYKEITLLDLSRP